jgi:hypothetical protein
MDVEVPRSKYDYYNTMPANKLDPDYMNTILPKFVTGDDDTILEVAQQLKEIADGEGYDRFQLAEFVLSFVQSKNYKGDIGDYVRYPFQTLVSEGDCEDSSVLTASLLEALGYEVVLVEAPGHLAVGVYIDGKGTLKYKDKGYYYMETTGEGWGLGEIPPVYRVSSLRIVPLGG